MPIVSLDRVDVRLWGREVLRGVSLAVHDGESWALLGGNGAGKSTLLRVLRGEEQPTPETRPRRRYRLDATPQESPIGAPARIALVSPERQEAYRRRDWAMKAESAIRAGFTDSIWLPEEPAADEERRVDEACALLGIEGLRRRSVLELSTGELRRVLIARALVTRPRLLLLDEPCDGLDPESRARFLALLAGLLLHGPALVLATHRHEEVLPGIARVAVMEEGRIAVQGAREEVLAGLATATATATPTPTPTATATATPTPTPTATPTPTPTPTATGDPLLRIEHADVWLEGRPVLHDLGWTVRRGEHWAVRGPNGSGKSTLLRLAVGDEQAMPGGTVRRLGLSERASVWEVKARVGVVSPELQARFRADIPAEAVVLSGLTSSVGIDFDPSPAQAARAHRALAQVGAAHLQGRRIHALSYGEMRRLVVARALVGDPELLVLDEPMNGLDPGARADLASTLEQLAAAGVTLVVATHHPGELPAAVAWELELRQGRVAYRGPRRG